MTIQDIQGGASPDTFFRQLTELQRFYGLLPRPPADPFALFVWEVLSLKATPRGRDVAFAAMRRGHTLTPDALVRAPRAKLESAVAAAGGATELRLSALRAGAEVFRRQRTFGAVLRGSLLVARRILRLLPQLDQAAAHRMLLFAADRPVLPVDARVERVARRLGYGWDGTAKSSARVVRRALGQMFEGDVEACRRAFVYLEHHGGVTCTESDPHCAICPLLGDCPDGRRRSEISRA
jgi:endonuclease III